MKKRRELDDGKAPALRFQDALSPACCPCAVPDDDWLAWSREREVAGRAAGLGSIAAVRRTLRALRAAAFASMTERLRARADLLGSAVFLGLILFIFHRLWTAVAGPTGEAGGFTIAQLVTYLLVTEVVTMSPGQVHQRIAEDVRTGAFTVALLRPLSYAQWELARALGETAARALALGAAGLCVLWRLGAIPQIDPRGLVLGLGLLVPAALLLELCARVLIGLAAFWMEDSAPLYWIWQKSSFVLGGLFLPLELYPSWLQAVTAWLPFRSVLHGPARTVIAFEPATALGDVLALALWTGVFVVGLVAVESVGRRRVQVNGG